jgi:starch synthase (maltosyl-transferring)
MEEGRKRVVIENMKPEIDCGLFPIKRVIGEKVIVEADIFADGHDSVSAALLSKKRGGGEWKEAPMVCLGEDRWRGEFIVEELGTYFYTVEGWVDRYMTWRSDIQKKFRAGQNILVDLQIGRDLLEKCSKSADKPEREEIRGVLSSIKDLDMEKALDVLCGERMSVLAAKYPDRGLATRHRAKYPIVVDRGKALFSTWYEIFPRASAMRSDRHGTFKDCESLLPEISRMGFDVLYFPPVHPIGKTNRKGRNNSPSAGPGDIGSPWAIGSEEGGHTAVHPALGTMEDFERLIDKAGGHGIEIAMDLAFQCSPDHPYVKEHPQWFRTRPDGTVQYAENPPKKYEDILPLNFETDQWKELWEELKRVVLFWIGKGVKIFRVDNPHTKAFPFWEWLIRDVRGAYPDVIFLAEAFTRPKVMGRLAKIGFNQSYTYFTWRNTKSEFMTYMRETLRTEAGEYFRPNFWPNTPDILPEHLQYGGRAAFMMRLLLAATLSSSYGIYGPAFELCVGEALPGGEEYLDSEKYELKDWDWDRAGNLKDFIARVNSIRRENPALQTTRNLRFYDAESDYLLCYGKSTGDLSNILFIVVNLDPSHTQSGFVRVPIGEIGIDPAEPYLVHELLSDDKYIWQGERNYVEIDPRVLPGNVFRVRRRMRRETDFDYFM